jgi:hypothetical protein
MSASRIFLSPPHMSGREMDSAPISTASWKPFKE